MACVCGCSTSTEHQLEADSEGSEESNSWHRLVRVDWGMNWYLKGPVTSLPSYVVPG